MTSLGGHFCIQELTALSPLPLGSLPLAPSTLSLLAEQRYNDEFDDEEREPDEDEYVYSVKYQRENGDC